MNNINRSSKIPQVSRISRLFFNIPQLHNQYNYIPLSCLSSSCSVPKSSSSLTIQKLNMGHQFLFLCCLQLPETEESFKEGLIQMALVLINNSLSSIVHKANWTMFTRLKHRWSREAGGGRQGGYKTS